MDIVIFGVGGLGREVHQLLRDVMEQQTFVSGSEIERWHFTGFIDQNPETWGTTLHDYPVLGGMEWLSQNPNVGVVVAIGNPAAKRKVVNKIVEEFPSVTLPTVIHPSVIMGDRIQIGAGCIICAGTILTTDLVIGDHVIVNLDCTIAHDDVIDQFVTIAPSVNVSGNVRVGAGTDLGTASTIIQGIEIGPWSIIGAGSVVIRNIPGNVTAVGNPAKVIKERPEKWYE